MIRSDEGLTLETSAFRISVRWPIYIINSVDKTKFLYTTSPPTQHHSFFRNYPFIHMETKVLRSAIETYPIIILILTQMIQNFLATKPEFSFMFVTVLSETRSSLSSVWKAPSFCLFMNIFRTQNRCFLRF